MIKVLESYAPKNVIYVFKGEVRIFNAFSWLIFTCCEVIKIIYISADAIKQTEEGASYKVDIDHFLKSETNCLNVSIQKMIV